MYSIFSASRDLARSLIGTYVLVATVVVIVLSILGYQEWRDRKEKKESVVDVYSAESLDKLAKLLSRAEEEIEIVGITLQELQHTMTTLESLLKKKGFRMKILLVDPDNFELMPLINEQVVSNKTEGKISATISELKKFPARDNFELKVHKLIPPMTLIIMDPSRKSASIQMEPYPHGITSEDRRVFRVYKKKQPEPFEILARSFNNMWNSGHTASVPRP